MGRSVYTPQTIHFLVHQQEHQGKHCPYDPTQHKSNVVSGSSSSSSLTTGTTSSSSGSSTVVQTTWTVPSVTTSSIPNYSRVPTHVLGPEYAADMSKPPLTWSQRSFDPDDENLPFVVERPLRPLDSIEDSFLSQLEGVEINYEITDRQGRYLYDIDDNPLPTGPLEPEQAVLHERRLSGRTAAAVAAMGGEGVAVVMDENGEVAAGTNVLDEEEGDDVEEEAREEGDVRHGNGGYYDFPARTRSTSVTITTVAPLLSSSSSSSSPSQSRPQQQQQQQVSMTNDNDNNQDTFSPSAGIFHTHTLPFNLPDNPNALNLQRRISGGHHQQGPYNNIHNSQVALAQDIHDIM